MAERPTATATCEYCAWTMNYTDDDVLAVAGFLREKLIAHCEEKHPEQTDKARRIHLVRSEVGLRVGARHDGTDKFKDK